MKTVWFIVIVMQGFGGNALTRMVVASTPQHYETQSECLQAIPNASGAWRKEIIRPFGAACIEGKLAE